MAEPILVSAPQFDLINTSKTGVVTVNELEAGMKVLKTHQSVTLKEVQDIISKHDATKQGGLEFEDFLRVPLRPFLFVSALSGSSVCRRCAISNAQIGDFGLSL